MSNSRNIFFLGIGAMSFAVVFVVVSVAYDHRHPQSAAPVATAVGAGAFVGELRSVKLYNECRNGAIFPTFKQQQWSGKEWIDVQQPSEGAKP